jgi:DNA repair exonuclease SbcCD ATPase subunit
MNIIKINRVQLQNFGPFENQSLKIGVGIFLTLGENRDSATASSNGSGKSYLLEAVGYGLFGKTFREDVERIGKSATATTEVKIDFTVCTPADSREFTVIRGNKLSVVVDGENVASRKKQETQARLEKLLDLSYPQYLALVAPPQGMASFFCSLTAVSRKTMIEELALDSWNALTKKIKGDFKELTERHYELAYKLNKIEHDAIALDSNIKGQMEAYEEFQRRSTSTNQKMREDVSSLVAAHKQKDFDTSKIDKLPELGEEKHKVEVKIDDLNILMTSGICPTCGRGATQKQKKSIASDVEALKLRSSELGELYAEANAEKKRFTENATAIAELEQKLKLLTPTEIDSPDLSDLTRDLDHLQKEIASYATEKTEMDFDISNYKFILEQLKPKSEFRSYLLGKTLQVLNSTLNNSSSTMDGVVSLSMQGDGIEISFVRDGKQIPVKNLSGGEKKRLDLALLLCFMQYIHENSPTTLNIAIFDEIFDSLDEQGIENSINLINSLPEDMAIFIISHNDSLKQFIPDTLKVVKQNGISCLQ